MYFAIKKKGKILNLKHSSSLQTYSSFPFSPSRLLLCLPSLIFAFVCAFACASVVGEKVSNLRMLCWECEPSIDCRCNGSAKLVKEKRFRNLLRSRFFRSRYLYFQIQIFWIRQVADLDISDLQPIFYFLFLIRGSECASTYISLYYI